MPQTRAFSQQRAFRNNPQLLPQLSQIVSYLDTGTTQLLRFFLCLPWFMATPTACLSTVQRYLRLFSVTGLPTATRSAAWAPLFCFLSRCEEVFLFCAETGTEENPNGTV